jgi:hypothetical protein
MGQPYGECAADNWRLDGNAGKMTKRDVRRSQTHPFGILIAITDPRGLRPQRGRRVIYAVHNGHRAPVAQSDRAAAF